MTLFGILLALLSINVGIEADIVFGKCPKVTGINLSCHEILKFFNQSRRQNILNVSISGYLASSPVSQTINIFALDHQEDESILHEVYIILKCLDQRPKDPDVHFQIATKKNNLEKFLSLPYDIATTKTDGVTAIAYMVPGSQKICAPLLAKNFKYAIQFKQERFFAIWGCLQLSKMTYDRGLYVLNPIQKIQNSTELVKEVLKDMKLEEQEDIWKNLIINEHSFRSPSKSNISEDRFYWCYGAKPQEFKNFMGRTNRAIFEHEASARKNAYIQSVVAFIYIVVMVMLVIGALFCSFYHHNTALEGLLNV